MKTMSIRGGALLVALIGSLFLIACGGLVARPAAPAPGDDLVLVIPPGTAAARMRGEPAYSIPAHMTLVAGQSVVVRNQDAAMHYFFFAPVAPGETFRKTFNQPGAFGYSGFLSCSVADIDTVTVIVTPAPDR